MHFHYHGNKIRLERSQISMLGGTQPPFSSVHFVLFHLYLFSFFLFFFTFFLLIPPTMQALNND